MHKHTEHKPENNEGIGTLMEHGKELAGHVRDQAAARIRATHKAVHENPYKAVAIAVGIGALIGFFLARRGSSGETE